MRHYNIFIAGLILMVVLVAVYPFDVEARQAIVLFDEGHGQRFLADQAGPLDLSGLSALFQKEGLLVKSSKEEITEKVLADADVLVLSGAFAPFKLPEISAIVNFVQQGGQLCVMLHVGLPVAELLKELNVYVSKGVVHEQENLIQQAETNYYVTVSGQHELMNGLEWFKVFGGWALLTDNKNAETIAQTSASAWIDTNMNGKRDARELQRSLGLAIAGTAGDGRFVVFGDDAIFQNQYLSEENIQLGKNLAKWLSGNELTPPSNRAFL